MCMRIYIYIDIHTSIHVYAVDSWLAPRFFGLKRQKWGDVIVLKATRIWKWGTPTSVTGGPAMLYSIGSPRVASSRGSILAPTKCPFLPFLPQISKLPKNRSENSASLVATLKTPISLCWPKLQAMEETMFLHVLAGSQNQTFSYLGGISGKTAPKPQNNSFVKPLTQQEETTATNMWSRETRSKSN